MLVLELVEANLLDDGLASAVSSVDVELSEDVQLLEEIFKQPGP